MFTCISDEVTMIKFSKVSDSSEAYDYVTYHELMLSLLFSVFTSL